VQNDAIFIGEMVDALKAHLLEGTILAALIVWLFLKSFRSTLIIATAIPVSLLGAIAVMYFFGFTFNSVTLLALLLLIGVVVDDAIVVLENIYRHREHLTEDTLAAAVNGSREVTFAVFAASISLVAIFAPVIFVSGILGQFLRSFAVVVTFGVLVSLFVSLTLTPMLCSRYLQVRKKHGRVYWLLEHAFERLDRFYRSSLAWALAHRWKVLAGAALITAAVVPLFKLLPTELAPQADEGRFLIGIRTPLGSSIHYTESKLREVEEIVFRYPDVVTEFGVIGLGSAGQVNQATLVGRMKSKSERRQSGGLTQAEVLVALRRDLAQIAGARAFPRAFGIVQGQRSEPLQFVVKGPNLEQMGRHAGDLQDLALAINMLTGGVDIAKYNDHPGDGERYDIRVKAKEGEFASQLDLAKIYLRNRQGQLVRLDSVAAFHERIGPAVIGRFDLQYAATFFASPSIPLATAMERVREAAKQLPLGYTVVFIGEAEQLEKTRQATAFTFALALVLLFMVLASQFNSFLQPFFIMLAVPLAIVGGVLALWLFVPLSQLGQALGVRIPMHTLNIYSMIGLVLLIGLVAKNSILLVDLTNQRRAQGMSVDQALLDACPIRMRPVMMTSATIVLALTPAAFGLGAGAETNAPLAVAVIGGMITSTLLTLVVVPAAYSLLENWRERRRVRRTLAQTLQQQGPV
jgi:HAE1 family hydrophobic/amphiphilic exporter-1